MQPVSWSVSGESSRRLRLFAYVAASVVGGMVGVLVVGLLVAALALVVLPGQDADPGRLIAFLVVLVIGSPTLVVLGWLWISDRDRGPVTVGLPGWLDRRVVALGSIACATAFFLVPDLVPLFLWVVAPVAAILGFARFEGQIDPESRQLHYHRRTVDIDDVTGVTCVSVGPVRLCLLRYADGSDELFPPRVLGVPRHVADRVEAALESGVRRPAPEAEPRDSSRVEGVVLAALGVGAVAFGAWIAVTGAIPTVLGVYVGGIFGLWGALFCWLAYKRL